MLGWMTLKMMTLMTKMIKMNMLKKKVNTVL